MNVREAIQKMNEKILEIRLAAAEQRPLLNDEDKEKLDELVNRSIEVVKNAGNKIESTVNELAQDEKIDEFLQRVGDRCEEACNFTIDRIRSIGAEYAAKEEEAPAEETPVEDTPAEPAAETPAEEPVEEVTEEAPEETVEETVEEVKEAVEEVRDEVEEVKEDVKEAAECACETAEDAVEEIKDTVTDVVEETCECQNEEEKPSECCCGESEQKEECCCKEETPAEEAPVEEPVKEFKAEPEEKKEPSPVDLFLMSDDVQSVVKTVKDVSSNVRKGFDDYYNRPETQDDIRKAKKAILDLAEKGMELLRKALADDE
ncbi:MAG: hypothetical protein Q4F09_01025 [Erysipelotrichaceae bacterium]|nr:hypothetical protein [Erysipelotrichaceae bacterium]